MDSRLWCLLPTVVGAAVSDGVRLGSTSHVDIQRVVGVELASPNHRCKYIKHARVVRGHCGLSVAIVAQAWLSASLGCGLGLPE